MLGGRSLEKTTIENICIPIFTTCEDRIIPELCLRDFELLLSTGKAYPRVASFVPEFMLEKAIENEDTS